MRDENKTHRVPTQPSSGTPFGSRLPAVGLEHHREHRGSSEHGTGLAPFSKAGVIDASEKAWRGSVLCGLDHVAENLVRAWFMLLRNRSKRLRFAGSRSSLECGGRKQNSLERPRDALLRPRVSMGCSKLLIRVYPPRSRSSTGIRRSDETVSSAATHRMVV
jgi:hypothetical protein